jgi:hypothetical protein
MRCEIGIRRGGIVVPSIVIESEEKDVDQNGAIEEFHTPTKSPRPTSETYSAQSPDSVLLTRRNSLPPKLDDDSNVSQADNKPDIAFLSTDEGRPKKLKRARSLRKFASRAFRRKKKKDKSKEENDEEGQGCKVS